ncbi:hypothetical protein ACKKBG_A29455 [Auxenochlorella protothecoides x Auxenochlorella symbiontica]
MENESFAFCPADREWETVPMISSKTEADDGFSFPPELEAFLSASVLGLDDDSRTWSLNSSHISTDSGASLGPASSPSPRPAQGIVSTCPALVSQAPGPIAPTGRGPARKAPTRKRYPRVKQAQNKVPGPPHPHTRSSLHHKHMASRHGPPSHAMGMYSVAVTSGSQPGQHSRRLEVRMAGAAPGSGSVIPSPHAPSPAMTGDATPPGQPTITLAGSGNAAPDVRLAPPAAAQREGSTLQLHLCTPTLRLTPVLPIRVDAILPPISFAAGQGAEAGQSLRANAA